MPPHAAGASRQEVSKTLAHLGGRLVGEGDRQDLPGTHALVVDHVRDAVGKHARLARARAREHEQRALGALGRLALGGVEGREEPPRSTAARQAQGRVLPAGSAGSAGPADVRARPASRSSGLRRKTVAAALMTCDSPGALPRRAVRSFCSNESNRTDGQHWPSEGNSARLSEASRAIDPYADASATHDLPRISKTISMPMFCAYSATVSKLTCLRPRSSSLTVRGLISQVFAANSMVQPSSLRRRRSTPPALAVDGHKVLAG